VDAGSEQRSRAGAEREVDAGRLNGGQHCRRSLGELAVFGEGSVG
jgi:hypothetical protein